ncbi:MAG: hypothetical protein IJ424_08275 [Oscillospiraceae bacterium]|nr:hypothetical protein [Oscillospiraceae bacterium]
MKNITVSDITLKSLSAQSLTFREKAAIAKSLDSLGVDVIELPMPGSAKEEAVVDSTIAASVTNACVAIPVGMSEETLETAWSCVKNAVSPCLQIEIPTSTVGMEYIWHMKAPKMLSAAEKMIKLAKEKCECVELVALDATRAERDFLVALCKMAAENSVCAVTLCDDAGIFLPEDFAKMVAEIKAQCDVKICVMPSDDIGMACACAVAAVNAGADGVKTAVTGSRLAVDSFAQIVKIKGDELGVSVSVDLTRCNFEAKNLKNVFETAKTETANAEILNVNEVTLTANSTYPEVCEAISALGYDLSDEDKGRVYEDFQRLARKKKEISTKEFEAVIATSAMQAPSTYHVESYVANCGNIISAMSNITLVKDGEKLMGVATGDGPIDASFKAIEQIIGHHYELDDFKITAVTQGKEAVGEAIVKLRANGKLYSGTGISTDIIGASIRAYVNALNKIVYAEN